jgi:hypothetical protein
MATERRTTTPADVPTELVDLAERTLDTTTTGDPDTEITQREAIRAMLAAVLPAYELRLGAELGRLTMPCPKHDLPGIIQADCVSCHRHTALVGARRLIEGRDGYAGLIRRAALQEADNGSG